MIIRLFLIGAVLICAFLAMRGTGSSHQLAVRRMTLLAFTGAWIVAVLFPDLLTRIAVIVGVGRGTDLLLYGLVVSVLLMAIGVYQRFARLEARLEDLIRELAILGASRAAADEVPPRRLSVVSEQSTDGSVLDPDQRHAL